MATTADHTIASPVTRTRPERLTPDDDLFVRMEHALGLPVINQAVWRLPEPMDREHFLALGDALAAGRMSRLVIRTPFPLRDRWVHTPQAGRYEFDDRRIESRDAPAWALAQARTRLDTEAGPSWRLSAITTADTHETFVSWISAHAVGDGAAVITAVEEALRGITFDTANPQPDLVEVVRESASALTVAASAAARLVGGRTRPSQPVPPPTEPAPPITESVWTGMSPTVTVTVAADDFDAAAARVRGTANTLFTAIVIGVLKATGRVADGDEIPVGLPVSTRTPDDRRANATTGVTARFTVTPGLGEDLAPLRAASKQAFASADDAPGSLTLLGTLAQPLGDRVVRLLAANSSAPLCLASNLGTLSTTFAGLGTGSAGPVAMRSMTVGASAATMRRMAGGISGWASRSAGVLTLCVTALDPDRVPDTATLTGLVGDELSRWDLSGSFWEA